MDIVNHYSMWEPRTVARRRTYDNSARSAQAEETRVRILDAAIELIGRPAGDLVIAEVAALAEVSVPTVYKHFANRDVLFAGLRARVDETTDRPPRARSVAELRAQIPELHRFFAARAGLLRAMTTSPGLASLRAQAFRQRDANLQRLLAPFCRHLSAEEATAFRALCFRVAAAPSWLELTDEHHLPPDVITRMATLAFNALLDRLIADAARAGYRGDEAAPVPPPEPAPTRRRR